MDLNDHQASRAAELLAECCDGHGRSLTDLDQWLRKLRSGGEDNAVVDWVWEELELWSFLPPETRLTGDHPKLPGVHLEILTEYRTGGLGVLYRGRRWSDDPNLNLDGDVLIKTVRLKPDLTADEVEGVRNALQTEIRFLLQLTHQFVVPVLDFGIHQRAKGSLLFYVMPFYQAARPLSRFMEENEWGTSDPAKILEFFHHLSGVLDYLHTRNVVHADLSANNVLVNEKLPLLIDFGFSRVLSQFDPKALLGGTPGYVAPEVLNRELPSVKSDVYSLGVLLGETLLGLKPEDIAALPAASLVQRFQENAPEVLQRCASEWQGRLAEIFDRTKNDDPARRYASVGPLLLQLTDISDLWRRRARKRTPTLTFGLRDRKPTYEPRNAPDTGRDILEVLHEGFAQRPRQLLHGLKGMGKTETAVTYAHQFKQHYPVRLWIDASSRDTLFKDFQNLAQQLESDYRHDKDQHLMVRGVLQTLADPERIASWLAVYDNVEKPDDLDGFLPGADHGKVLLTSYLTDLRPLEIPPEARLEVRRFPLEAARHFLLRRSGRAGRALAGPEAQALKDMLEEFDGLPLALEHAGAWLAANPKCPLADYFASYRSSRLEAHRLFAEALNQKLYPHTVATTWLMNFAAVERENPASADALRLCALLEAEGIPLELFRQGHPHLGERIATALADVGAVPTRLHALLRPLQKYSLVSLGEDHLSFGHRLVQAVVLDGLDQPARLAWLERLVAALNDLLPTPDFSIWAQWRRWIKHVVRLLARASGEEYESLPLAVLLNNLAGLLNATGRYGETEPLYRRALGIWEKALGPAHPDVATSLNNLAALLDATGRYGEAEPLYRRALGIREQALGPEHPDVAQSLNNLAELLRTTGRYAEAEPLYRRALGIREQALGPEHPYVATSLNNLAGLLKATGRYGEAEPLVRRALGIREQALGPAHPDVATSLNNLAALLDATGRYGEAEPLYRRALGIWEQALGPAHPDVASSLNNLAALLYATGRHGEAEPLYRRALEIREQALGPAHPDVASSLNNLAALLYATGRYGEAEPLVRRALGIREQALGPEHPDVAQSLNNLAELLRTTGRYGEAEPLVRRALGIREQALGPEHPDVAQSLNNLAELLRTTGRYAEAEPLVRRALGIREQALGPEHPDVATSLNNLAELLRTTGRYAEAEPLYRRALGIREQALGPEHPYVATSLNNLAGLLKATGRYAEAEPLYRRALGILEKVFGQTHPLTQTVFGNLRTFYREQGEVEKLRELEQRFGA